MPARFSTVFATASLFGFGLLVGCSLPNTIGLSCTEDSHCIGAGAQYCGDDGKCIAGVRGDGDSDDGSDTAGETEESSDTTSEKEDMPSKQDMGGPQCGAAIGSCDKADVLIVVDNSGSATEDELLSLVSNGDFVTDLLQVLAFDPCDVHIGVTTTEAAPDYQPEACQTLGALNRGSSAGEPDTEDCWDGGPPYFRTGDDAAGLLCAIAPGDRYDDNERQVQTILNALGPDLNGEGGCNEGFLRDDAKLFIFLVTDEDDDDDSENPEEAESRTGSPGGPTSWIDELAQLKPLEDTGILTIMATNGCDEFVPLPGFDDGVVGTAERGLRLGQFIGLFAVNGFPDHTETINICQPLEELVEDMKQTGPLMDAVCNG